VKNFALQLWRDRKFWRAVQFASLLGLVVLNLAACGLATWLSDANTILPVVLDSVLGVLTLVSTLRGGALSPAEADAITNFGASIQNALQQIQTMVDDYEQSASATLLAEITAAVNAVKSDLANFLPTVRITDPATQAEIEDVFTLVSEQITAWATVIPALTGTATATVPTPAGSAHLTVAHDKFELVTPLSKKAYKAAYNAILARMTGNAEVDAALAKLKRL
jgi:hypothetical protein